MSGRGRGFRVALAGGTALMLLAWASRPMAATSAEDQDARIARLEAAVSALQSQAQAQAVVKQENASLRAQDAELGQEVSDLEAQVLDLKGSTAAQIQDVRSAATSTVATIANGKPTISTADGAFSATLHGVMQFDAGQSFIASAGPVATDLRRTGPALGATTSNAEAIRARDLNSGTNFRRARIGIDGKVFSNFDYSVLFDFGGSGAEDAGRIQELWVQYSGWKPFKLKIGAFQPSTGLEDQNSTNGMPFLERPAPSDVARSLGAGDFRTGAQLYASGDRWFASGAVTGNLVSTLNTTGTATSQAFDEQLAVVGRVAFQPFHGYDWLTHVGVHGTWLARPADTLGPAASGASPLGRYTVQFRERPELRIDGTRLIDTGAIDARHASDVGLEFAFQKKSFYVEAELERLAVERAAPGVSNPHFNAFYVEGSWILTGEARRYNTVSASFDAPPVDHPFTLHGGRGAWELAVRYSDLNLNYNAGAAGTALATVAIPGGTTTDGIRGGEQQIWSLGVNWYLNSVVRLMLDLQRVKVDRLAPNAAAFNTPVGAQIGQSYNAIALRTQAAF